MRPGQPFEGAFSDDEFLVLGFHVDAQLFYALKFARNLRSPRRDCVEIGLIHTSERSAPFCGFASFARGKGEREAENAYKGRAQLVLRSKRVLPRGVPA